MSIFSPLLVVCYGREESHDISDLARSLGHPDAHIVEGGITEAVSALGTRTNAPDYIIVDIGERGNEILPELDTLAQHCEPTVRVVVIGGINDISFYRELRQRGVLEYFARPITVSDIRAVLLQGAVQQYIQPVTNNKCTVISFMSAASGDGATTLALNTAYSLAQDFQQPTVLLDMDYQYGLISKSLDLSAPFGIRELFDHPDRGLDNMLINKMLVKYKDNLSIIGAPGDLHLLPTIRPEVIRELLAVLRTQFRFIIIDVPHVWTEWTSAALTYSDHVAMVAQLWLRSLTHASRLMSAWQSIGLAKGDVSLLINRSGAKFKEAITAKDFERICHHKVDAYINNDVKAITQAETHAKTLMELEETGLLQQQIRQFAQGMVTRFQGEAATGLRNPVLSDKKKLLTLFKKTD